jgi:nitrate reductase NapD
MNIAGVLVHARAERHGAIRQSLARMPGVEVHQATADGRLVVTVEDTAETAAADSLLAIHRLDGVVSAALVYHHFEPEGDPAKTEEKPYAAITA